LLASSILAWCVAAMLVVVIVLMMLLHLLPSGRKHYPLAMTKIVEIVVHAPKRPLLLLL